MYLIDFSFFLILIYNFFVIPNGERNPPLLPLHLFGGSGSVQWISPSIPYAYPESQNDTVLIRNDSMVRSE